METKISVVPYVWKYIWHTYGPGDRFDLTSNPRSDLKLALLNMNLTATLIPQTKRLPGKWVVFELGNTKELRNVVKQQEPFLKAGAYFQSEFMKALSFYIEAQRELAIVKGMKEHEWNARIALESFMRKYEIEEDEYSYDSLRRQYNRLNVKNEHHFLHKLSQKFEFCPFRSTDYQYFRPAYANFQKKKEIVFWAYSRKSREIVRQRMRIPRNILASPHCLELVKMICDYINTHLRAGCSIH